MELAVPCFFAALRAFLAQLRLAFIVPAGDRFVRRRLAQRSLQANDFRRASPGRPRRTTLSRPFSRNPYTLAPVRATDEWLADFPAVPWVGTITVADRTLPDLPWPPSVTVARAPGAFSWPSALSTSAPEAHRFLSRLSEADACLHGNFRTSIATPVHAVRGPMS